MKSIRNLIALSAFTTLLAFRASAQCPVIAATPASLANGASNQAYGPVSFNATPAGTYAFEAFGLPAGLVMSGAGSLSGIPTQTGSFAVRAVATDTNGCLATHILPLTVCLGASVSVGSSATTICAATNVTFTATPTNGGASPSYQWLVNGSAAPGGTNSTTYSSTALANGDQVRVQMTSNATPCVSPAIADSNTISMTVNPIPATPTITPGGPTTFCTGGSVTLTSSSASGNQWLKDGNPIAGQTGTSTIATTSGTYTVVVTTSGCASAPSTGTVVTVNAAPASPTITPTPATLCAGKAGNTADGPGGATTYAWTITGGTITSATNIQTITYTAGAAGTLVLSLTVTNAATCSTANTANITVNALPSATITPGAANACASGTGQTASAPAGLTYAWTATNGTITSAANIQTITYTAGASGTVALNLTVTNASTGCTASSSTNVPIIAKPTLSPAAGALADGFYFNGYSQTFTGSGGTAPYSYGISAAPAGLTLSAAGVLSGASPALPNNTGSFGFNITVTDANGCSTTQGYTLAVRPRAIADTFTFVPGNTQLLGGSYTPAPATVTATAGNLLANDLAPAGVTATAVASGTTTLSGNIKIKTDGTFLYTPPRNVTGSDTFTYTIVSNGQTSAAATLTFTLQNKVWFVDASAVAGNNGTSDNPYTTLGAALTQAAANEYIYVKQAAGAGTDAGTMKAGQTLVGRGVAFTLGLLSTTAGTFPTSGGSLTLGGNTTSIKGINFSTGTLPGITNNGTATSGATIASVSVTTTTGTAVSFSNLDANAISFTAVNANGAVNGIVLTNLNLTSGTFAVIGDGGTAKNGTGGTIQATTGNSIVLTQVKNLTFKNMIVQNTPQFGLRGTLVSNFEWSYNSMINLGSSTLITYGFAIGPSLSAAADLTGVVKLVGNSFQTMDNIAVLMQSGSGTITSLDFSSNTITDMKGAALSLGFAGTVNASAVTITSNTVNGGAASTLGSQGLAVGVTAVGAGPDSPTAVVTFNGNTISSTDGNGISASISNTTFNATPRLRLKIQNNTVGAPKSGVRQGIRVQAGTLAAHVDNLCMNISGNTSAGSTPTSLGIGLRRQTGSAVTYGINGMAATASPGVEAYVDAQNPLGGGTLLISGTTGFAGCSLP
ncbi:MAG: putative Ig domain-containing protein [Thermoanaerobaculia bacterium]